MDLNTFIQNLTNSAPQMDFEDTMAVIEQHYSYTPTRFLNGLGDNPVVNEAGTNEGSCKIFAFAKLNSLSEQQTLNCFGRFYHEDVQQHPDASDHGNIRSFIEYGWSGIQFDSQALTAK
ncbi:HopJ type III effector protein [Aliamphritea ceti]|uniref:HopJ type III effector protein n=1 Tax=Aliamphritea ceti TaxID=1524258 RepID=UPI0021C3D1DF|nr:HopJ type III effector protein [Aliamphritea ceti]